MNRLVVGLLVASTLVLGCKSEEQKRREEAEKQFVTAAKQMAEAAKVMGAQGAASGMKGAATGMQGAAAGMQQGAAAMQKMAQAMAAKGATGARAEPVDFRELKGLLPESLADLQRKEASGEKAGAMGFVVAQAKARYKGEGNARLSLKIIDTGGLFGPMAFAAAGLATMEIDKETEDGYEKSTVFEGRKAFEKYNNKSRRGEVKVIVANRFVVELDGNDLTMDDLKAAAKTIDYGKLETLGAAAAR